MDDDLRNSLWSLLTLVYWESYQAPGSAHFGHRGDYVRGSNLEKIAVPLWLHHFKKPVDTLHTYWPECLAFLRAYYFQCDWAQVYDFVEFVADSGTPEKRSRFIELSNSYLERENSAYRFVNGVVAEITSEEEISEVEAAFASATPFAGVRTHLAAALALMSNRLNPDYRNSIKESVSAVESLAKHISGDSSATLGEILKAMERKQQLHSALKSAFSALYGYTNDAEGIRHGLMDEPNLTKAEARFMLVGCSAFVNYAIDVLVVK